jgi:pimeloyl-ACP methyl ester carboxylesterase
MSVFQSGPKIYELSARARRWYGSVLGSEIEDQKNLRNSGCRHLLILVHGFNNSEKQATESYGLFFALVEEHFRQSRVAPDAVAYLHWPGDIGRGPGLVKAPLYAFDVDRAKESAKVLVNYLKTFPGADSETASFKITLVGHSLGCRLLLEMLAKLPPRPIASVGVVSLMAPAVPVKLAQTGGGLRLGVMPPCRLLKLHSKNDDVLHYAFPLGQAAAATLGYETEVYTEAVGRFGNPDDIGVSVATNNGHSDYWGDRNAANKLSAAIDPTFFTLPAPNQIASRTLPQTSPLDNRTLPARDLAD